LLKITDNVDEFKQEDDCVVYFTASWCGPCKALKPQYGRVAVMDPKTNYYMVDVDKVDQDAIQYYNIQSIPQVFVMKSGEINKTIKSRTAETILQELGK
jgi:thioredoxin 1